MRRALRGRDGLFRSLLGVRPPVAQEVQPAEIGERNDTRIVAGASWGRVRALINDKGEQIKSAGPSTPVEVLGLSSVPEAGDEFRSAPDERIARTVGEASARFRKSRSPRSKAWSRRSEGPKISRSSAGACFAKLSSHAGNSSSCQPA